MIKYLFLDVDGTLTDGGIYISSNGSEYKKFQGKDGLVVRVLPEIGIKTVIFTGRDSRLTQIRADDLRISFVVQGVRDKIKTLTKFFDENGIEPQNAAYIGDDLNDCAAMKLCGFRACPNDAAEEVKNICNYVSPINGGYGAVRDIVEYLLKNEGRWDMMLKYFDV